GYAAERSRGKDTPSGHWELMGLPVEFDWGYFPKEDPAFPYRLIDDLVAQAHLPGVLGNRHASGTAIIEELGEAHMRTGEPIVYTSADSVFQIAAHEETFGLERLYEVCRIARRLADRYRVGRVIARPFVGSGPGDFRRTANRKDLATPPHGPTLLDLHKAAGGEVIAIGKIGDIFAHKGITKEVKAAGNDDIFDTLLTALEEAPGRALIFANLVDFDTLYGHRRDVPGYAAALEVFDRRLPELQNRLQADDIAVLTADHGCDPTWEGSDHTREFVPVLVFGPRVKPGFIGRRESFADVGQSLARIFGHAPLTAGTAFLEPAGARS
ncbi:MAG: phosphopentomutase, partial [Alphaproteobacteria bacterium]